MKFDNEQKRAINHLNGPFLLIAGPGSGKTTTMIERLANMIINKHIIPERILVITFSRAAASEMKSRFLKRMNLEKSSVVFGTFHSVFLSMIKQFFGEQIKFTLITDEIKRKYIKATMSEMGYKYVSNDFFNEFLMDISLFKNSCMEISDYKPVSCDNETFVRIYSGYERLLIKNENIDFEDIIILMNNFLSNNIKFRTYWQNKFDYILIDEFQDINKQQFNAIALLGNVHKNIFAVGDEDQSIYSFRGSNPQIMLDFPKVFESTKICYLTTNYRSGKNIVEKASALIAHNKNRFVKDFRAFNSYNAIIDIRKFENKNEQVNSIKNELDKALEGSIAILCRTNADKFFLKSELKDYDINILTMHESKGLEFDFVWLINVSNGISPFKHPLYGCNMEEERRLFYVAVTRAKKKLIISFCTSHKGFKKKKSVFINELNL